MFSFGGGAVRDFFFFEKIHHLHLPRYLNKISKIYTKLTLCMFGSNLKSKFILLFNLFLLLFISFTAIFNTIHEFHCTISINFYLYLSYFQQKNFYFL